MWSEALTPGLQDCKYLHETSHKNIYIRSQLIGWESGSKKGQGDHVRLMLIESVYLKLLLGV